MLWNYMIPVPQNQLAPFLKISDIFWFPRIYLLNIFEIFILSFIIGNNCLTHINRKSGTLYV